MIEFKVNKSNTAIVLIFTGAVDTQQTEELHNSLEKIMPKIKKGFKLLTNLSFMESMDVDAHLSIEKSMQLMDKYGVSQISRIIPDSNKDIGFNIMSMINYSSGVKVNTYTSAGEALQSVFLKD